MFTMPYLLWYLLQVAYLTDPELWKATYNVFIHESPWRWLLRGRRTHSGPKGLHKKKKPSVYFRTDGTIKEKLWTYLVPVAVSVFKVGCYVEGRLRELLASHHLRELPSFPDQPLPLCPAQLTAPIGIDTHTSRCMVNAPHLFEDLKLGEVGEVEGIKAGLDIKGTGTFKLKIKDNNGMTHKIEILNSLYVPELKRCLLSPQHWVQEAKDSYPRPKDTRMSQDDECYYVYWGQAKYQKLVPYNPSTNIQSSTLPLCCVPTVCSPPPLKLWKRPSSNGRGSSNSQGAPHHQQA